MPTVHFNKFSQVLDSEFSECNNAVVAGAAFPNSSDFRFHFNGDIEDPINSFPQFGGDAVDCLDRMHIVELHDHAALARDRAFMLQGKSSCMREMGMSSGRVRIWPAMYVDRCRLFWS